ncbi:MucBP domain-containing protein [Enterococcus pallens]|uniref:MucBP domain-containing protein n=1 Tax=Enterococcus pallens ATCC BAA-351 TaxID=1158607 RepID=R2T1J5_9ENTE|nr:MucBP domain-containing protein [Enterococcus pallens]EOH94139.1 hypothetical protein UAU_01874 [Enterococcus pallens ATCC BAA-351]EOU24018.1 hypothetical protein I588_00005 [Enterococcus pallens ATCC BAA-351]OJG73862.1 hypothetical protein RV10_GL004740 [Enterococcus pallens]
MKNKKEYVSKGLLLLMILLFSTSPIVVNAVGTGQSSSTTEETFNSKSTTVSESEEVIASQATQENTESATTDSSEAEVIDDNQVSKKDADYEMISSITTETFWWDTVHNKNFRYNSDIPPNDAGYCTTNHTQGYLELSDTRKFDVGWKFINITFKGEVYSPGDRIYDEMFLGNPNTEELQKHLRYNFEPLLFNVQISYQGLPSDVVETLPKFDPNPVLSETMYTIPEAPEVEGYVSADYVWFRTSPYDMRVKIGDQISVSGGTISDRFIYIYEPKVEAQPVVSYYLDTEGNPLADEASTLGEIDEEYTTTAKTIPGYTLVKVEGNTSGKYTAAQQEVRYIYLKDSPGNFDGSYIDYAENTVTSINDVERQLKIVKNANLSLVSYENNKLTSKVIGSTQQANLVGTVQTVSKRIQTENGRVYYMMTIDGKQYILHSNAFQALPTSSDFEQESDLDKYANVSLDFVGNYLDKINSVNHTISLVNNYNVYDLLKTDGDAAIPPYTGTVSSLGLKDSVFTVNQEFVSNNGIKYYRILVEGYSYFINAAAFVIETVQSMF